MTWKKKVSFGHLVQLPNGYPAIRVKEIHYHDDDLHSKDYRREMEIYLHFVALGLPSEIIGVSNRYNRDLEAENLF